MDRDVMFTMEITRVIFREGRQAPNHAAQATSRQYREGVCHEAGAGGFTRSGFYRIGIGGFGYEYNDV